MGVHTIVDGGYASWTYGTRLGAVLEWDHLKQPYTRRSGAIWAMDCPSGVGYRTQRYPEYKARRRSLSRDALHAQVQSFRDRLWEDPELCCWAQPGLEADDLIAVYCLIAPTPPLVIGRDKDLLQIPHIRLSTIALDAVTLQTHVRWLPTGLQHQVRRSRDLLLLLSLLGDRSDGIPRALPPRSLSTVVKLLREPWPFRLAYELLGEQFLQNVELAVLPGPPCYQEPVWGLELLRQLDAGEYQRQAISPSLTSAVTSRIMTEY